MTATQFPAEWALRSSILILSGALLLWALRVKDSAIRLAAWTAMLVGSLAIPALTAALPKVPLIVMRGATRLVETPIVLHEATPVPENTSVAQHGTRVSGQFDWKRAAVTIYVLVGLALLLRLCVGLAMSRRLLRGSRATGRWTGGIEIRESDRVAAPSALGIVRPAIMLPDDWRHWEDAKLDAVLAHEFAHPASRSGAAAALGDSQGAVVAQPAELFFAPARRAGSGGSERRCGSGRNTRSCLLRRSAAGFHEAWCAWSQRAWSADGAVRQAGTAYRSHSGGCGAFARGHTMECFGNSGIWIAAGIRDGGGASSEHPRAGAGTSSGQQIRDGGQAGIRARLSEWSGQSGDQALLADARRARDAILIAQLEGRARTDQANIDNAKLQLVYTEIRSPITGVAGLLMVDPGNIVHAADSTGIVIISQLQPIAILFTLPEDVLPQVRPLLRQSAGVPVEAWNRDNTIKSGTGRLTAVDNQIDQTTGMAKLKAVFDNNDEALFPNQFVIVRLIVSGR